MGWLRSVPWQAWGRQVLRYLACVCGMQLADGLFGVRPSGLMTHLLIAFIVLDGRSVWRRLTGRTGAGNDAAPRPRPSSDDRRTLLIVGGGVALVIALAVGLQAMERKHNLTVLTTDHFRVEVFATAKGLADRAVAHLESRLGELETAFGLQVTDRPLIRVYDWQDFDTGALGNYREGQIRLQVGTAPSCADCVHTDQTVIVHEYTHFLTHERSKSSGGCGSVGFINIPLWLNEGLSFWYGGGADSGMKPEDALPLERLTRARTPVEVLNEQSYLLVSQLMATFGEQRTLSLIDAYAGGDQNALTHVLGISEAELLEQVRASLQR